MLQFLKCDDRNAIFKNLEELFSNKENAYYKIISYYKKNLIYNNFINYS